MDGAALNTCMAHLEAAEQLMEDGADLASLARLALVIDMLRRAHGLPDRTLPGAMIDQP